MIEPRQINKTINKDIEDTFFPNDADEAVRKLYLIRKLEEEAENEMQKIEEECKNGREVDDQVKLELSNSYSKYISFSRLEVRVLKHCFQLTKAQKEELNRKVQYYKKLSGKQLFKLTNQYLETKPKLEDKPFSFMCGQKIKKCNAHFICGSFFCLRKSKNDLILVLLAYPENDNWIVYDVIPNNDGSIISYSVKAKNLYPMPKSLPKNFGEESDLRKNEKVLCLWREDDHSVWTTKFYEGVVLKEPRKRGDGYLIRYDEDQSESIVFEQFVIPNDAFQEKK